MPKRWKVDMRSTIDGFTEWGYGPERVSHQKGYLGTKQYIDSSLPKGSKIILLQEPITRSFYPPMNPVELSKYTVSATPLTQNFWCYADGYWLKYHETAGLSNLLWIKRLESWAPPVPDQSMKDLAFAMALSRVAQSPFEGAVDLGELSETIRFMKSPMKSLAEIFTRFGKKVDRRIGTKFHPVTDPSKSGRRVVRNGVRVSMERHKRISELIADTWLEGRYAVAPLIYSACGLAETAATDVASLVQRVHSARGGNKRTSTTVFDKYADWLDDGLMNFCRSTKVTETVTYGAFYVIRYIYYPWMIDAINLARYGISPTQLGSTLYELTPLSFVGDWFVNFGTWLKAMEPKPQCQILDICYTHKGELDMRAEDNGGAFSYYSRVPKVDATCEVYVKYMNRSNVTTTVTAPTPRLKGQMLTMAQSLDAVALLGRPIERFFRRFAKFI